MEPINLFISILEMILGQLIQEELKERKKENKEGRWV